MPRYVAMNGDMRVGYEARLIDGLMARRHAPRAGAAIGAVAGVALLIAYGERPGNVGDPLHLISNRAAVFAVPAALFGIGGWWTVHTWNVLWRRGRDAHERILYDYGVRTFGFLMAIVVLIVVGWLGWMNDQGTIFGPLMSGGLLCGALFGLPTCLHLGYFWGSVFASFVGVPPDPRTTNGQPPRVSS